MAPQPLDQLTGDYQTVDVLIDGPGDLGTLFAAALTVEDDTAVGDTAASLTQHTIESCAVNAARDFLGFDVGNMSKAQIHGDLIGVWFTTLIQRIEKERLQIKKRKGHKGVKVDNSLLKHQVKRTMEVVHMMLNSQTNYALREDYKDPRTFRLHLMKHSPASIENVLICAVQLLMAMESFQKLSKTGQMVHRTPRSVQAIHDACRNLLRHCRAIYLLREQHVQRLCGLLIKTAHSDPVNIRLNPDSPSAIRCVLLNVQTFDELDNERALSLLNTLRKEMLQGKWKKQEGRYLHFEEMLRGRVEHRLGWLLQPNCKDTE